MNPLFPKSKSPRALYGIGLLAVATAIMAFAACTKEKNDVTEMFPYEEISPATWRALKSVRDSFLPMPDLAKLYEDRTHKNGLPYHVYAPETLSPEKVYPLVIFLHGHTDLNLDTHGGVPKGIWSLPDVLAKHPHVLFVPRHKTAEDDWTSGEYRNMVLETLDDLVEEFNQDRSLPNIDVNRLYLTGFSQGAMGVWDYIKRYPLKFAAAVPLSGYFHGPGNETEANAIKHIPIWIFNGSDDDGVDGSRSSYQYLKQAGAADVRYHEFSGHGHVIDDFAFFTEGFFDWLFAQAKPKK